MIQLLSDPTLKRIAVTFIILIVGYLAGQLLARMLKRYSEYRLEGEKVTEKVKRRRREPYKSVRYLTFTITLAIALVYLNSSATNQLFAQIGTNITPIITAGLTLILGLLVVRLIVSSFAGFVSTVGLKRYAKELGFSGKVVDGFFKAVELFLYLVVLEIAANQLGVSSQIISSTLTIAAYSVVGVLALLAFFGFKDLVQNYAAGMYIRASDVLKPGKKVKIDGESGEIRDISAFGTTVTTDGGYFMLTPNKSLMDKNILFKRVKADVETLEDIKNYFVAQDPSYCGPASAEMALTMFGYDVEQGTLADVSGTTQPGGVLPDDLITAVEQLTNREVRADFVEYNHITDLAEECKTWFNDGGLIIVNFAKPVLFPNTDTAHYSLALGVEGDELLIVDPSAHTTTGGVYYVDKDEMLDAMAEWEGRARGYIVMAPKGTTAHWRIKEGLIYAKKSVYDHLSKSLELQLGKILRRGRILKHVMPDAAEDFLEHWRSDERVRRLWKAEKPKKGGEKKLDEFTDTDE